MLNGSILYGTKHRGSISMSQITTEVLEKPLHRVDMPLSLSARQQNDPQMGEREC